MTLANHGRKLEPFLTRDRLVRYPLILLCVTVAVYALKLSQAKDWILPDGHVIGEDYFAFFMAGDMVNDGDVDALYRGDGVPQRDYQSEFMAGKNAKWSDQDVCLYLNPPHYAWAMSLIARFGYGVSLVIWWLLSLVAFAVVLAIWRGWLRSYDFVLVAVLAFCAPPFFQALAGGQNSFFSLLVLTGFCALLLKQREFYAGVVLAMLGYKFQLLVVPVLLLLFCRRWRALVGFGLASAATFGFIAIVMGSKVIGDYVAFGRDLSKLMQVTGFDIHKQHSWYGFFSLVGKGWMPLIVVKALTAMTSIGTLVLLARVWRVGWKPKASIFPLQLSALIIATVVTSAHLFHYDTLILLLPAALWYFAACCDPDIQSDTRDVRWLLLVGFIWLALAAPIAQFTRIQLSPLLLLLWLWYLHQAVANHSRRLVS